MSRQLQARRRHESVGWHTEVRVDKWDPDQTAWVKHRSGLVRPEARIFRELGIRPAEISHGPTPGNRLVTVGLNVLTARLIGTTGTAPNPFDNTHVGLAVGNGSTADAIGDTDMGGASKRYNAMDATYPQQANGVLTLKATYANGEAEFTWDEYGAVVNSPTTAAFAAGTSKPANYVLLNRKSPAGLGTKAAGSTWAFTMTITIV